MCDSEIDKITKKLLAIKSLIHGRGSPSEKLDIGLKSIENNEVHPDVLARIE